MTRNMIRGGIFLALVMGLLAFVVSAADAHTPGGGATCQGYFVTATSYEAGNVNTIESKLDGVEVKRNFATSDSIAGSWPQDGYPHTWSGYVHTNNSNKSYSKDYGPITLTCGTHKTAAFTKSVKAPDCFNGAILTYSGTDVVFSGPASGVKGPLSSVHVSAVPKSGASWSDGSTGARDVYNGALAGDLSATQACHTQPPNDVENQTVVDAPDCVNHTITTEYQERTRSYSWNGTAYVPGDWSAWTTTSTSTTATTDENCPVPPPPPVCDECHMVAHTPTVNVDKFTCAGAYTGQTYANIVVTKRNRDCTLVSSYINGSFYSSNGTANITQADVYVVGSDILAGWTGTASVGGLGATCGLDPEVGNSLQFLSGHNVKVCGDVKVCKSTLVSAVTGRVMLNGLTSDSLRLSHIRKGQFIKDSGDNHKAQQVIRIRNGHFPNGIKWVNTNRPIVIDNTWSHGKLIQHKRFKLHHGSI